MTTIPSFPCRRHGRAKHTTQKVLRIIKVLKAISNSSTSYLNYCLSIPEPDNSKAHRAQTQHLIAANVPVPSVAENQLQTCV